MAHDRGNEWVELVQRYEDETRSVLVVDAELNIMAMSVGLASSFGFDEISVHGTPALDLLHPDDLVRAADVVLELLAQPGARPPGMYRVRDGSGYRTADIGAINETLSDGEIAIVYLITEMTERRRAEALATEQVEIMELLAGRATIEDCLFALCRFGERHLSDTDVCITRLRRGLEAKVTAGSDVEPSVIERNSAMRADTLPENVLDAAERGLAALSTSGIGPFGMENGSLVTTVLRSSGGELLGFVEGFRRSGEYTTNGEWSVFELVGRLGALFIDRMLVDEQLTHAATHDPLTDLANRRLLSDELGRYCDREDPFALAVVDLDQFSWINETFGHPVGDEVLIEMARRLRTAVGERALVSRPGGDEFVVLVPGINSPLQLESLGNRLHQAMLDPLEILGGRRHIRASIGLVIGDENGEPERILASADAAMFVAKRAGGDGCHIPAEMASEDHRHRYDMIRGLATAISTDELHLVYQPMVELDTGRWVNVEALVRWEQNGRVVAGPEEFVSLAEQSDLILSLDEWVLRTAGTQMARWQETGLLPPDGVVWVNVSPRTIERPDFVEVVQAAAPDLPAGCLGVEVTERAVDIDPAAVASTLALVRAANIPVALDDFGTGVASLQQLAECPATDLKIDGSFVEKMLVSDTYRTLVETILQLAQRLGMTVTAEAIETNEQLEVLRELGCGLGQGFHIAPPMNAEHLVEWQQARSVT